MKYLQHTLLLLFKQMEMRIRGGGREEGMERWTDRQTDVEKGVNWLPPSHVMLKIWGFIRR